MVNNIVLIGTSHISEESVKEIKGYIDDHRPDIVAVELDPERMKALMENVPRKVSLKNIGMAKKIGITGFFFAYIASLVQRKLGDKVKTKAGSDMLTAIRIAKENNLKIALIDQRVDTTLKNLSKEMRFREKILIIFDTLRGLISKNYGAKELGIKNLDLKKVPQQELIEKVLKKTKHRYPGLYKALVHDRNDYMAKKLLRISLKNPDMKILAVVGAGHKVEMQELLEEKFKKIDSGKMEFVG